MLSLKGQILRRFKPSLRVFDKPRLHKKVYYTLIVQSQKVFENDLDGDIDLRSRISRWNVLYIDCFYDWAQCWYAQRDLYLL